MNIIVLGGTGFLGTKLVKKLVAEGNTLYVPFKATDLLEDPIFTSPVVHLAPVEDLASVVPTNVTLDMAYSLIGVYSRKGVPDINVIEGNLIVPLRYLDFCLSRGVKKFVSIDTGLPDDFNIYSKTKASFREMAKWYAERTPGFAFANISLELFYGEDEPRNRFIPNTILRLKNNEEINMTTGLQKRDYIYADDAVAVLAKLSSLDLPTFLNLPVGTGVAPSVREVVLYLKEIIGSSSIINFGAVPLRTNEPDSVADTAVMKSLGLEAPTDWKSGMAILAKKIS